MVIITAGVIGIGKSTLAEMVAERRGSRVFYESVDDNPVLEKYYEDPKEWGFETQVYFLGKRRRSIIEAYKNDDDVLDRSIFEDKVFAYLNYMDGNMTKIHYDIYIDLFDEMMKEIKEMDKERPDLLIYLDGSFDTMISRIKKRGREFEQSEELFGYYKKLHEAYKSWIKEYNESPVIVVDMDKYDLTIPEHKEEVLNMIDKKIEEIENT